MNGLDYRDSFLISQVGVTAFKTESHAIRVDVVNDSLFCPLKCNREYLIKRLGRRSFAMFVAPPLSFVLSFSL